MNNIPEEGKIIYSVLPDGQHQWRMYRDGFTSTLQSAFYFTEAYVRKTLDAGIEKAKVDGPDA